VDSLDLAIKSVAPKVTKATEIDKKPFSILEIRPPMIPAEAIKEYLDKVSKLKKKNKISSNPKQQKKQ